MWQFTHPDLPTTAIDTPTGAPLFTVDRGESMAPLAQIDVQAHYTQPGINSAFAPVTVLLPTPSYTGTTASISVRSSGLIHVSAIAQSGQLFTPAKDATSPQPQEFVYDPIAQTVTLTLAQPLIAVLPLQIIGGVAALTTDEVDPSLFSQFYGLNITAQLSWSLSAENHPSGSIQALANGDSITDIRQRFLTGTELTFAGIGFYVKTYKEKLANTTLFPGFEYEISISLSGHWERRRYNRPCFLNPNAAKRITATSALPYQDPDCSILSNTTSNGLTLRVYKVSVRDLAAQNNVPFVAYNPPLQRRDDAIAALQSSTSLRDQLLLKSLNQLKQTPGVGLDAWDIPIPKDSARDATAKWDDSARGLLRQNGCFIDFSDPSAVRARAIDDAAHWDYTLAELEWTNKGDCEFSGSMFGYGVEYAAAKLTGAFAEVPFISFYEDAQAMPNNPPQTRWKRKEANIRTLKSGDDDASTCPSNITTIKTMSLNADASGRTTEAIVSTKENGIEVRRERVLYGLAYTSSEVNTSSGINAPAAPFWKAILNEVTEPDIDDDTGYILGSRTIGAKYSRFKQETDDLEALGLPTTAPEYPLYQFQWDPSITQEKKLLAEYATYYPDAQREVPPYDTQKICNPDGTSILKAIPDPNYVRPMFELASRTFKSSFAHVKNPDSAPGAPLPDLTKGEESDEYRTVQILPNPLLQVTVGLNPFEQPKTGNQESKDLFVEWTYENSAQGENFNEITTHRTFADHEGRPAGAQRRPALYEKEQFEQNFSDPNQWNDPQRLKYEWILCSPGHSPLEPSGDSISFPNARYWCQALTAAQTDYKIRDLLESVEFSGAIPFNGVIRPFDFVTARAGADRYPIRIVSVNQTVLIQGTINGFPLVTASEGTKLNAGIDREIPFTVTKRPLPLPPVPPLPPGTVSGVTLGDLNIDNLRTRSNF